MLRTLAQVSLQFDVYWLDRAYTSWPVPSFLVDHILVFLLRLSSWFAQGDLQSTSISKSDLFGGCLSIRHFLLRFLGFWDFYGNFINDYLGGYTDPTSGRSRLVVHGQLRTFYGNSRFE